MAEGCRRREAHLAPVVSGLEIFKAGLDALKNKLKVYQQFREGEKGDTHTTTRSRGGAALMENKELKRVNCMRKGKLTLSSKFLK